MIKFLKHELKTTSRMFLILIGGMAIANLMMYPLLKSFTNSEFTQSYEGMATLKSIGIGLSSIVLTVCGFIFLFMIISSYRKEFYQNTGYLTFSLPITSSQFVGAKLIAATIWSVCLGIMMLLINIIGLLIFFPWVNIGTIISDIIKELAKYPIASTTFIYYFIVSFFLSMVALYYSITLSKVLFTTNRGGYLWVLIYPITTYLIDQICSIANRILPYYIDFSGKGILKAVYQAGHTTNYSVFLTVNPTLGTGMGSAGFPLPTLILYPVAAVALFIVTTYLMDRKLDL